MNVQPVNLLLLDQKKLFCSLKDMLLLCLCSRIESQSSSTPSNNNVQTKTHVSSTGDKQQPQQQHADLDKIEVKVDKKVESVQQNQKHSNTSSGFSLKNPVSSFRSWVTQKKSAKEDSTRLNHSATSYGKIDTSPTPRKSSSDFDNLKRTRTNSASASNASSAIHNHHHQDVPSNPSSPPSTSLSPSSSAARVKKKSSFTLRHTNPIALLKRTAETNHQTAVNTSNNDPTGHSSSGGAGGSGSSGGAFGYLKSLVRGESSGSERKQ